MRVVLVALVVAFFGLACSDGDDLPAPTLTLVSPTPEEASSPLPFQPDQPILYTISADGAVMRSMYAGRAFLDYALSPDGQTIALSDAAQDEAALYLLDLNTGALEEIVKAYWLRLFEWSPDGQLLAFELIEEAEGPREFYVYSAEEGDAFLVREQEDSFSGLHAWTNDSNEVYISEGYGPSALIRVEVRSSEETRLDLAFDQIALSPDGSTFAVGEFRRQQGNQPGQGYTIDLVHVDGSNRRTLVELDDIFVAGGLAWSPDGGRISFSQARIREGVGLLSGIYVIDIETGNTVRASEAQEGVDTEATWSTDGETLLVRRHVCTQCDGPGSKYVLAAADGSGERSLGGTDNFELSDGAWSPVDPQFAYGADALYLGQVDAAREDVLADLEASSYVGISWSADGEDIFFVRVPDLSPTVYAAAPDGSSGISTLGGNVMPSPDGQLLASLDPDTGEPVIWAQPGRSGHLRHEAIEGLSFQVSDFVWAPDSRSVAIASWQLQDRVLIWSSGELLLAETPNRTSLIRWSQSSDRFAYSDQERVWAVDAATGEREVLLDATVAAFDWSPNGNEMAVLDHDSLTVVSLLDEVESRRIVMKPPPPVGDPTLRWSPDGEYLAIGDVRSLHVISAATGDVLFEGVVAVDGLAWSSDGAYLAFGAVGSEGEDVDAGVQLLEVESGELVQLTVRASRGQVVHGWLDDGRVLFASYFRL